MSEIYIPISFLPNGRRFARSLKIIFYELDKQSEENKDKMINLIVEFRKDEKADK